MNKKILAQTLLPITSITLLGGGIATSLVLTSCSSNSSKVIILDTVEKVNNYLIAHKQTGHDVVPFTFSVGGSGQRVLDSPAGYLMNVLPLYNKQAFINGVIYQIYMKNKDNDLYIKIDGNTIYSRDGDGWASTLWEIKHFNTLADFSFIQTEKEGDEKYSDEFINTGLTPEASDNDIVYNPKDGVGTPENSYITMDLSFGESSIEYSFCQSHYDFWNFSFSQSIS